MPMARPTRAGLPPPQAWASQWRTINRQHVNMPSMRSEDGRQRQVALAPAMGVSGRGAAAVADGEAAASTRQRPECGSSCEARIVGLLAGLRRGEMMAIRLAAGASAVDSRFSAARRHRRERAATDPACPRAGERGERHPHSRAHAQPQGHRLDIPRHRLVVVVTGLSGSGKSSLARHTLYAEGSGAYGGSLPMRGSFCSLMDKPT